MNARTLLSLPHRAGAFAAALALCVHLSGCRPGSDDSAGPGETSSRRSALAGTSPTNMFSTLTPTAVAGQPASTVAGDFNADGIPDLAVTSTATSSVSILLGIGDGNFQAAVSYPVGADPVAVVAGDFNHDAHLDLAVVNNTPNTSFAGGSVSVLFGKGDGTFAAGGTYPVGYLPTAIAVGDVDGDGNPDLAVVVSNPNFSLIPGFVTILLGSANGGFQAQGNYGVGVAPTAIAVGDFTGDGKVDLAVGSPVNGVSFNPQSEISILVNQGAGTFQAGPSFPLGPLETVPTSIAAADFNSDGKLDLAVALNGTSNVVICQGSGDGSFSVVTTPLVGTNPVWVAAGDLNGDGKTDLAVTNNDGTVSILLGNGDESMQAQSSYAVGSQPGTMSLADLNKDGSLDIAVVSFHDNTVQVLLGANDGTFRAGRYAVGGNPIAIIARDFNRDGIPDLAVLSNFDNSVSIFLGDGHGGFRPSTLPNVCPANGGGQPGDLAAADVVVAGTLDLIVGCGPPGGGQGQHYLFQGHGDGTFSDTSLIGVASPLDPIVTADFDGDGRVDVLVGGPQGDLELLVKGAIVGLASVATDNLAIGDFNGDGKADFVADEVGNGNDVSQVFLGDGHAGFRPSPIVSVPGFLSMVGDFDGDGLDDLSLASFDDQSRQIALSNGDGTFRPGASVDGLRDQVLVADVDGDGILDVINVQQGGSLGVHLGDVNGSFGDAVGILPYDGIFIQMVAADFNGDGAPDIAIIDQDTTNLVILLNTKRFIRTSSAISQLAPLNLVSGQPTTLSAAVTGSNQGMPTGSITFKQGGVPQTSVSLNNGTAQTTLTLPPVVGRYGFTALYTGDGTYSGSLSQRLLVTVSPASTTTLLRSSDPTSKLGQAVTFTATVSPPYAGVPTGTVQFYADGEPIGLGVLAGGNASIQVSSLAMGKHTIEADYSGDGNFITSLGTLRETIGKAASTVTVTSSANPALFGSAVTLTAALTDSEGAVATGSVTFAEGATIYGTVLLAGGAAQITLPALAAGTHKIVAQYGGDTADGSANGSLSQIIQGLSTLTSVVTDSEPSIFGQTVTFAALVTSATGTPDGNVTFKSGSTVLDTVPISGGLAQLSVSTLNGGTHTITALYDGTGVYATSSGTVQQIVQQAQTTTALASSANPGPVGQAITFTAVVSSPAVALPTGSVTFKDGKTALGVAPLVNGEAALSTSVLTAGAHTITATYGATANWASSKSTLTQAVQ
jgi:Bacterial Ig-like domain (group 3)/FG-GAP-like repeat/FG-GAP repeat